jgi:hypothetical protein
MNELQIDEIESKEDSPAKLAAVKKTPKKYVLFANEFNAIVVALKKSISTQAGNDKINILINKDDPSDALEYEFLIVDFTDPDETEITFNQETDLKTLPLKVGRMYGLMLIKTDAHEVSFFGNIQFDSDANGHFGMLGENIIMDCSYGNDTVIGYFSTDFMINIILNKE